MNSPEEVEQKRQIIVKIDVQISFIEEEVDTLIRAKQRIAKAKRAITNLILDLELVTQEEK